MLDDPYDLHGSAAFERGALMPQSRGSMLVARAVDPQPGERVLDLCAAPGAKTTHLAALMGDEGEVVAVEHDPRRGGGPARERRAPRRRRACGSWSATRRGRITAAATTACWSTRRARTSARSSPAPTRAGARRRRRSSELRALQRRILEAGAAAVRPGGRLVYSTCTISAPENERSDGGVPRRRHPEFGLTTGRPVSFRLFRTATARTGSSSQPSSDMDDVEHRAVPGYLGRSLLTRTAAVRAAASRGCARPSSPGRYRCVYCLTRFQLMAYCPACGEHSTIVRMSDTDQMDCVRCGGSMLKPV